MPGIILRSPSLAVLRSSGSCPMSFAASLAASRPVENSTATTRPISRFMAGLLSRGLLSLDAEQLHLEDQGGAGRDHPAGPAIAVAQMRGDDQLALASHLHRDDAFVPALDHAALAHRELERAAAVHRAVELLAALEPAGVVHAHGVAGL